jgi:hypothetical protein
MSSGEDLSPETNFGIKLRLIPYFSANANVRWHERRDDGATLNRQYLSREIGREKQISSGRAAI